ncbi:MAG: hypothetical protein ACNFW9_04635 [Candidatus Kerfeldbacteria bacterium]
MNHKKLIFWSFFLILTIFLIPQISIAQSTIDNTYNNYLKPIFENFGGETIIVSEDTIIEDNFFRYGENITINGDIQGDIIVIAGQKLIINGEVSGDVLAIAETIEINGPVIGNVRVIGAEVNISNSIGKNINIISNDTTITNKATIGWTLSFISANININAPVNGSIYGYGGEININNTVGNNVTLILDDLGQVNIDEKTVINGRFEYRGDRIAVINDKATIQGNTIHKLVPEKITQAKKFLSSYWIYAKLISFFSMLLVGTLLVSLFEKTSKRIVSELAVYPFNKILLGLIMIVGIPFAAILISITVIGIPLAIISMAIYIFLYFISPIFIGLFIGNKILNLKKSNEDAPLIWAMLLGTFIFVLLKNIPYIGWLVGFLGTIWFFGTVAKIIQINKKSLKGKNNEKN